jgi:Flp pilus assembly protein TadD
MRSCLPGRAGVKPGGVFLLLAWFALASSSCRAQAGSTSGQAPSSAKDSKPPPAFSAAGVQGSTAPSGYSSGLTREETATIKRKVGDLDQELLVGLMPAASVQACSVESSLMEAVKADPKACTPNHALGVFFLDHGEFARAVPYFQAAHEVQPANGENLRGLALALLGAHRSREASTVLESATGTHDATLLRLLGLAYLIAGEPEQARATYQRAGAASSDADNLLGAGMGLIRAGDAKSALLLFTAATVSHPNEAKLWMGKGIAQDMGQHKADAVDSLLHAVQLDPDYAPPYSFLASLIEASPEKEDEVRKRLAEFVVAQPNLAESHYDYAVALERLRRSNPEKASAPEVETQLKLVLASDPSFAQAHYQLGVFYADSGDPEEAADQLLLAAKLEPDNAQTHYHLARVYQSTHQLEAAKGEMQEFQKLHGKEDADEMTPDPAPSDSLTNLVLRAAPAVPCK